MNRAFATLALRCVLALAVFGPASRVDGRALSIGGNSAVSGVLYGEVRSTLTTEFPGTTFTSLGALTGNLSGFDLIILDRVSAQPLLPAEQTNLHDFVMHGGNLLYVGDAINGLSNDSFTLPFGIAMTPDPTTDISIAYATYTNPGYPFMTGPFAAPTNPPSGSFAAQITTLGPSVELARWNGGGVAISAFAPNTLGPGAGFGLFLTDLNMVTPTRYSPEVGGVLANALALPEPSSLTFLLVGAAVCLHSGRFLRVRKKTRGSLASAFSRS